MSFEMDILKYAKANNLKVLTQTSPALINLREQRAMPVINVNTPILGEVQPEELGMRTIDQYFNAASIPPRHWIVERYALSRYITLIGAGGATGKSMFTLTIAVSVALGKDLLGLGGTKQGNVLVINNEDDDNELDRRLAGIFKLHRIKQGELTQRLYIKSGYGARVTICKKDGQVSLISADVEKIIKEINRCNIELLIVDPFVSTHEENENDNSAIDTVMNFYRHIASATKVAIILVHHTRKTSEEPDRNAGDVDVMRGASSLKDAARLCFTLSKMGSKAASEYGIDRRTQNQLSRLDDAKNNFTLSDGTIKWLKMESVQIDNGEWIGVPRSFDMPDLTNPSKASESSKEHSIFSYVARGIISLKGTEGGAVKRPELQAQLLLETKYEKSKLGNDLKALPKGSSNARRVYVDGRYYRIYQVDGKHPNAAKTIQLILDE